MSLDLDALAAHAPGAAALGSGGGGAHVDLDALEHHARRQSAAPAAAPPVGGGNPVANAIGGVLHLGGQVSERLGVPRVIDFLDRPRQTAQAALAGDHPLHTLLHGADQAQQDNNRDALRTRLKTNDAKDRSFLGGFSGGVEDFMVDSLSDPLSYVPGLDLLTLGRRGAGLAARGARAGLAAAHTAPGVVGKVTRPAAEAVELAGGGIAHQVQRLHDFGVYKGAAKRELGADRYHGAIQADTREQARQPEAARRLHEREAAAFAHLSDADMVTTHKAITGQLPTHAANGVPLLPPHVLKAVDDGRVLGRDLAGIQADGPARRFLSFNAASLGNAQYARSPHAVTVLRNGKPLQEFAGVGPAHPVGPARPDAEGGLDDFLGEFSRGRGEAEEVAPESRADRVRRAALARKNDTPAARHAAAALLGKDAKFASRLKPATVAAQEHPDDIVFAPRRKVIARTERPFEISENLREFQLPADQGPLGYGNVRRDYAPMPHADRFDPANRKAGSYNALRPFSGNLEQRDAPHIVAGATGADIRAGYHAAIENATKQAAAGNLRAAVGADRELTGIPEALRGLFEREYRGKGTLRSKPEMRADLYRGILNAPKNAVTILGARHGAINVPSLAAASEGSGAAAEALRRGTQMARMTPAERFEASRVGIDGGVIGAPSEAHENPITDLLGRIPGVGGKLKGAAAGVDNWTWAVNDAANQAVYARKIARGMKPTQAAAETMREMIDYGHRSKLTEALGNIATFATYRSKLPVAVASAALRNPRRALRYDRATQGLASGGEIQVGVNDDGTPRKLSVRPPQSEGYEVAANPAKYARGTIAAPFAIGATLAADAFGAHDAPKPVRNILEYLTRGQELGPHQDEDGNWKAGYAGQYAGGLLPFGIGDAVLNGSGLSEYGGGDALSGLLGSLGGIRLR